MSDVVEELRDLEKNTKESIKNVLAQYKYTQNLIKEWEDIVKDNHIESKEKRSAIKVFRWIARAERNGDRYERKVKEILKELDKILPENLKIEDEKLINQLDVEISNLEKLSSRFGGSVWKDIKDLEEDKDIEQKLKENIEKHVSELKKWLEAITITLKEVYQFEKELERIAA